LYKLKNVKIGSRVPDLPLRFKNFEILKLHYGAMGYPLDGGCNENKLKKSCAPHPWGFAVESARRYMYYYTECHNVHVLVDIPNVYFLNLK